MAILDISNKLFKYSKGQAATEFLFTYGWAILLVLVIMTILYSSIFKPEFYVAERCDIGPGISCDKFYLNKTENGLRFILRAHNSLGFDANITTLNFTLEDRINNKKYSKVETLNKVVKDRESFDVNIVFPVSNLESVSPGTLYYIYFTIKFKNNEINSPPEHTTAGIINVRVS